MQNRLLLFILCMIGLVLYQIPVLAAPTITVNPVWRPSSQLSSMDINQDGITDPGEDIRYVTVDIYATVNVEFWAIDFTCTVNRALLEAYVEDSDPNGSEDDWPMFYRGTSWGPVTTHGNANYINNTVDSNGNLEFAISLTGEGVLPLGSNGVMETLHLATLKYRVREDLTAAGTSTFQCTSRFLNRDGRVVLAPLYVAPPPLRVLTGYTLSGNVRYQGINTALTASQAIQIACDDADGDAVFDDVLTSANITTGNFSVSNLRNQGRYDCQFIPGIYNAALPVNEFTSLHLTGSTDFNLTSSTFNMLPVVLANGNVETENTTNYIHDADVLMVTSNWNAPQSILTAPYMYGDANGDRRIDSMDLAVVAGNYDEMEPDSTQHLIYSLARDATVSFNNHLWLGNLGASSVSLLSTATTRDYWPSLSPDGTKVAFVRNVGTGSSDIYALFTAPITNGVLGTAIRMTPATANYDAFAPAWSPDGSRIAFVCSYNDAWANIADPSGELCMIEANGSNFIRVSATSMGINIQTPAWATDDFIYLASRRFDTSGNGLSKVGRYRVFDNLFTSLGTSTPFGSDMPVVRMTPMGWGLFYRFHNGSYYSLRFASLNSANLAPSATYPDTAAPDFHMETGIVNIQYYTVSTGVDPDIAYYYFPSAIQFRYFSGTADAPAWLGAAPFYISDMLGNPAAATPYAAAIPITFALVP